MAKKRKKRVRLSKFSKTVVMPTIMTCSALLVALIVVESKEKPVKDLNNSLVNIGKEFYTDFYYKQFSESYEGEQLSEFLRKYEKIGFKINLDNISRYSSEKTDINDLLAHFDGNCNTEKTEVIIYPKEPYGRNDFEVDSVLECLF